MRVVAFEQQLFYSSRSKRTTCWIRPTYVGKREKMYLALETIAIEPIFLNFEVDRK